MFRKSLLLALPALVVLATAFAAFALERQRTPDWQVALNDYLAHSGEIAQDVAAVKPWNFDATVGNPQNRAAWPWDIDMLPYPPDALHCVLVQRAAPESNGAKGQWLFVAHHTDTLWRVGWVVHEGPNIPLQESDRAVLAELGCAMVSE